MRYLLAVMFLCALSGFSLAADPVTGANRAPWSSLGIGGDTASLVRNGLGFDPSDLAPADYFVCNESPDQQMGIDTPERSAVGNNPENRSFILEKSSCVCMNTPANIPFRSPTGIVISGHYTAYKRGHSCLSNPIAMGKLIQENLSCTRVFEKGSTPQLPGNYAALQCKVTLPNHKKSNYRICGNFDSLIRRDGSSYDIGNGSIIVDSKLANQDHNTGQGTKLQYTPLIECHDFYGISEAKVLVVPWTADQENGAFSVEHVNITVQQLRP